MSELKEIRDDLADIKKLLLGNGEIGVVEMARRAFTYTQWHKTTKNGRLDWTYRVFIAIIVGFIAVKIGLK